MLSLKYMAALALLTAPPKTIDLAEAAALHSKLAPSLRAVAIEWQILDRRESGHILKSPDQFADDLALLQKRYQELEEAPYVEECRRFPERKLINEYLAFNRAYRRDLEKQRKLDRIQSTQLTAALAESEKLYRIWDTLRDARCKIYYISARRRALKQLREMIGLSAFYSGQLPPHVPVWRFPEHPTSLESAN